MCVLQICDEGDDAIVQGGGGEGNVLAVGSSCL
jgi:hypothetical protein